MAQSGLPWLEGRAGCSVDAIVVGSGPNGLSAAITLARAGVSVTVLEAADTIGGGARSEALTLPGFVHDVCSAVFPLAVSSSAFTRFGLERNGLNWIQPPLPLAHPLDDGPAVVLERSVAATAAGLGSDGRRYIDLFEPFVRASRDLFEIALDPSGSWRRPALAARFGLLALRSARSVAESRFGTAPARALFAGLAAHSFVPLERAGTSAFALVLGTAAHAVGWPIAAGGAGQITKTLGAILESAGGRIVTGRHVASLDQLPPASAILCDLTPRQLLAIADQRLASSERHALARYRYGPAAFKLDWALAAPIPWRDERCTEAGTFHLGGTLEEIAAAEEAVAAGRCPERPFVLLSQPSRHDPSRAPHGRHTAWAYAHVPTGATRNMTEAIEAQVERFAPGFRDCILARSVMSPRDLERHNPNLVDGDIAGGSSDLAQLLLRPTWRHHRTSSNGLYLCSASTPPGGGVHGMCGYYAARLALREVFKERPD